MTLTGSYRFTSPPPAIGEATAQFASTLVLVADSWSGRGFFIYGGNDLEDVPVGQEPQ